MKLTQDTVVPNQRKSQVHGVNFLNIMRHSYNHSTVHTDQEIWHQDLINKTHSPSAISHSIHFGTGLFRNYLPGSLLSCGCMGSHHRGASGNTGKSACKLSHVSCLIRLASAPPLHHTPKNRVRIWIHSSLTIGCPWLSTPFIPAPSWGRGQSGKDTVCLEQEGQRGSLDPASSMVSDSSHGESHSPGEGCVWRGAWGRKQTLKSFQIPLIDTA